MLIDCDACSARGNACGDCVVTVVLARGRRGVDWDAQERAALRALADGGLLPRLRVMPPPADLPSTAWAPRARLAG
jgi:hypothetical protein